MQSNMASTKTKGKSRKGSGRNSGVQVKVTSKKAGMGGKQPRLFSKTFREAENDGAVDSDIAASDTEVEPVDAADVFKTNKKKGRSTTTQHWRFKKIYNEQGVPISTGVCIRTSKKGKHGEPIYFWTRPYDLTNVAVETVFKIRRTNFEDYTLEEVRDACHIAVSFY